jgi:hypothetical protein
METASFEVWRKRFDNRLLRGSDAWTALKACTDFASKPVSQLPEWFVFALREQPGWSNDVHTSVLRWIYNVTTTTTPVLHSKQKRDAYTRKALKDLTTKAESFVKNLKKSAQQDRSGERIMVTPDHGDFLAVNLAPLLAEYEKVATASRYFLDLLQRRPYSRKLDILNPGVVLMGILESTFGVLERQALELGRLAMLAHGHSEEDVEEMRSKVRIRDGKFRKRKEAGWQRMRSLKSLALRNPITKEPSS